MNCFSLSRYPPEEFSVLYFHLVSAFEYLDRRHNNFIIWIQWCAHQLTLIVDETFEKKKKKKTEHKQTTNVMTSEEFLDDNFSCVFSTKWIEFSYRLETSFMNRRRSGRKILKILPINLLVSIVIFIILIAVTDESFSLVFVGQSKSNVLLTASTCFSSLNEWQIDNYSILNNILAQLYLFIWPIFWMNFIAFMAY